jgi:glycosyltransferase involved in cell wall biosynthesis
LRVYKHIFWGIVPATFAGLLFIKDLRTIRKILNEFRHSVGSRQITKQFIKNGLTVFHNYCDLVIAPSQKIAKLLESYHTKPPVVVIPTGIDIHEKPAKWNLREFIFIPDDSRILMFTGRLGKEKNLGLAIRALAHIASKMPDLHMVFIGDGPYRTQLEYLSEELGIGNIVHFLGMQPHNRVLAAMGQSDLFVFPSLTDTQGLVLNESALMGLPMIWCDPDISAVTINHETGLLSKPTITAYAHQITTLLGNNELLETMKSAAHQAALAITIDLQAKALAKQYAQLIEN